MNCQYCNNQLPPNANNCPACGASVQQGQFQPQTQNYTPVSRSTYILLALFFGGIGIHNFYAKRIGVAITQIIVLIGQLIIIAANSTEETTYYPWITGVWVLFDIFSVKKDGKGNPMV